MKKTGLTKWLILNSSRDTIPPFKDDELLLFSLDNWSGKSVGSTIGILCMNSPENMPWDTSLNQDVKAGVEKHAAMTHDLDKSNPRKFSLSTPQRGSSAFI
jgi:hypothetical protein